MTNMIKSQIMHNHSIPVITKKLFRNMTSNIIINFRKVLCRRNTYTQLHALLTNQGQFY